MKKFLKKFWPEILFLTASFLFSWFLFWSTFDYKNNSFFIAAKAWSDFSATLPLIRSFSLGNNFPPMDPLFAGVTSHYHFIFYLIVGLLEKMGLSPAWALNLPSTLGFWSLQIAIYSLAKTVFKSRAVGFLSVLFFLFNGSFSFLEFFKVHSLSFNSLQEILTNTAFPSFGPYDGKIVSAFWNLNIYTNQRHLAPAFAILIFCYFFLIKFEKEEKPLPLKKAFFLGLVLSSLPFFHSVVFLMSLVLWTMTFLLFSRQRKSALIILSLMIVLGLPQLFLMNPGGTTNNLQIKPGYLIADRLSFAGFIIYWFFNLGIIPILAFLGFLKSSSLAKKIIISLIPLFLIPNLFQFSREMAANHKFLSFFIIFLNFYVAFFLTLLWKVHRVGKMAVFVLLFFCIFSGIIDFFPIKNDSFLILDDRPKNREILWITNNTKGNAAFLNSSYLYHPANLAGRPVFLGWPYFPWSLGLDAGKRETERKEIFAAASNDKNEICQKLLTNHLDFVTTETRVDDLKINYSFWGKEFVKVYENPKNGFIIYDVSQSCL